MAFFLLSCIPYCLRLRVLSDLWSHNGWILFLLEHRAAHSPSAADRIGSIGFKTNTTLWLPKSWIDQKKRLPSRIPRISYMKWQANSEDERSEVGSQLRSN
jgi:hypothetical protein